MREQRRVGPEVTVARLTRKYAARYSAPHAGRTRGRAHVPTCSGASRPSRAVARAQVGREDRSVPGSASDALRPFPAPVGRRRPRLAAVPPTWPRRRSRSLRTGPAPAPDPTSLPFAGARERGGPEGREDAASEERPALGRHCSR